MNTEQWNQLLSRLDLVSQKIGETGSAIFQMATRQARIDGIENLFLILLSIAVICVCRWVGKSAWDRTEQDRVEQRNSYRHWRKGDLAWFVSSITVGGAFSILLPVFLIEALDCLLNPQYRALENVMSMIVGK